MNAQPRAYSYIRFSTPEQAKGDSLRRQTEAARRWAEQHGVELDEQTTFQDLGKSAFYGGNMETGKLGEFLAAVRSGLIPKGSYLIVESLDRISRQTVRKAARAMEDIVDAGVKLVDLEDGGRVYSAETLDGDDMAFFVMAVRLMRGNAESKMKSIRLAGAYDNKRREAASGGAPSKPFTRMLPAWLRWNEDERKFELIGDRASVVRDMFRWADEEGLGQHAIAHRLNERGVATWGRAAHWHRSYVKKVLANPAALGTFTPHRALKDENRRRVRKPLDAIEGYWPAVVSTDVFDRVNARAAAIAPRGRNANREVVSLVSGLARCVCGNTVTRVSKGRWVYLRCTKAHARAGCEMPLVRYQAVEEAILDRRFLHDAPLGEETSDLDAEIAQLDAQLDVAVDISRGLVDELATNPSEAIRRRLADHEALLEQGLARLRELRQRRAMLANPQITRRLDALEHALKVVPLDIPAANRALKAAASRIVVDPARSELVFHWHHSDELTSTFFNSGKHSRVWDYGDDGH